MLSKNIARLRKERGLTQAKFAQSIHVTQAAVSQWETGKTSPDVQQMFIISDFFGITVEELSGSEKVAPSEVPATQPTKPLPPPESIPEYLARLTPENRAFIEDMAKRLLAMQQQEDK